MSWGSAPSPPSLQPHLSPPRLPLCHPVSTPHATAPPHLSLLCLSPGPISCPPRLSLDVSSPPPPPPPPLPPPQASFHCRGPSEPSICKGEVVLSLEQSVYYVYYVLSSAILLFLRCRWAGGLGGSPGSSRRSGAGGKEWHGPLQYSGLGCESGTDRLSFVLRTGVKHGGVCLPKTGEQDSPGCRLQMGCSGERWGGPGVWLGASAG